MVRMWPTKMERERHEISLGAACGSIQSPVRFEPGAKQLFDQVAELPPLQFP